jgi:hypothetical protein
MSWLYSQALVEEYLAGNSLDGEQSVQLSGNPTQLAYCAPDKMTDFSRLSRFGMTYRPLTDIPGEELSMSSVVDFHVRTLAQQERVTDLMEKEAECGDTWRGWLAKYDPDSCSWKTPQCSLLGEEQESLGTLPRWGMTVDGLLWEQPMLEPITSETGCGSWPTPNAWDGQRGPRSAENLATKKHQITLVTAVKHSPTTDHQNGGRLNPTWVEWLMGWPLGWTDLKPLGTDKSHCVQQKHGDC